MVEQFTQKTEAKLCMVSKYFQCTSIYYLLDISNNCEEQCQIKQQGPVVQN